MSKVGRDPVRDRNATAMLVQAVLQGAPIPMEEPTGWGILIWLLPLIALSSTAALATC